MSKNIREQTLASFPKLLKPIIRILLRSGIDFKQFVNLTRKLYVDVASEDYGIGGRPTNTSRISVLTGIGRASVTKIRKENNIKKPESYIKETNQASKVLHAWHNEELYTNDTGEPKTLPIDSYDDINLTTLVNKHRGDIPEKVLLKELISSRSVEMINSTHVQVTNKTFIPKEQRFKDIFTTDATLDALKNIIHFHSLIEKQIDKSKNNSSLSYSDAAHILSMWYLDQEFLTSKGTPLALKIDNSSISFKYLVEKYLNQADPAEIQRQLLEAKSVKTTKNGYIHPLNRRVMLPNSHIAYKARLSSVLTDIVNTLQHNLIRDETKSSRFEGRVTNRFLTKKLIPKFDSYLKKQGQDFLNKLDKWLDKNEKEQKDTIKESEKITLGAGLYMIYRPNESEQ